MQKAVRRKYIVKKELQLRFFFELIVFMFFVAALVGATVYLSIYKTLIFELSGEKVTLLHNVISYRLIVWFLPTVAAILIISVFLTHQIAGPIFVFQRAIKMMSEGRLVTMIHLRKHDKLNDFANDLNRLIDRFNRQESPELEQ